MKTIIAGSRDITDQQLVEDAIQESGFTITEVVCGEARGVDKLGKEWGLANGILPKSFPAEWDNFDLPIVRIKYRNGKKYNAAAGHVRNSDMAGYADALIAIWDGVSPGTKNMIDLALEYELEVYVKRTDKGWWEE